MRTFFAWHFHQILCKKTNKSPINTQICIEPNKTDTEPKKNKTQPIVNLYNWLSLIEFVNLLQFLFNQLKFKHRALIIGLFTSFIE